MASHFSLKPDEKAHPLSTRPADSPTGYSLEGDLARLVKAGRWRDATSVFEQFKNTELPALLSFNLALQAYGRSGQRLRVESLLREMEQRGVEPDARTYRTVLLFYAAKHYYKQMRGVVATMRAKGFKADVRVYNIVLSGYARMARRDDMLRAYQEMLADGVEPDVRSFTHLVRGFKKFGTQTDLAVVEEEREGRGVEPDDAYVAALEDAFQGTDIERADRFLGEN